MASGTTTANATWAGEAASAPPASGTTTANITFAANPVSVTSFSAAGTTTANATWAGEAASAPPASGTTTANISFAAEPISLTDPALWAVINNRFAGTVTLTGSSGIQVEFAYTEDMDAESLRYRGTRTATLDTGAYVYLGGFSHADRTLVLTKEQASRSEIDNAKLLVQGGLVTVSMWDGTYTGLCVDMQAKGGDLEMDIDITAQLN